MTTTFNSLAQLRSRSWATKDEAVKELRRNSFKPQGADYELRQVSPDSWQIVDKTDLPTGGEAPLATGRKAPPMQRIRAAAATKTAAAKKSEAEKPAEQPAEAKVPAASKAAAAKGNGKANGTTGEGHKLFPDPAALPPPVEPPAPPAPPATRDVRAELEALAARVTNPLAPLPPDGGPYTYRITPKIPTSVVMEALSMSRKLRTPVQILAPDGTVLREMDAATLRPARGAGGGRAAVAGTRGASEVPPTQLAIDALAAAKRKNGVKRTELSAMNDGVVINWKGYLQRIGKREGLVVTVDKSGDTPVYKLVPQAS